MWIYIWLGVTVLSLIVEFFTNEMICIWFAGGALVSLILSSFNLTWYIHVPAFIVVSVVMLLFFRKMVLKKFNKGESKTNAESAIGKEYVLLSDIGFNKLGTIKINDVIWNVDTEDQKEEITAGETVVIKRLKGNKYVVEKVGNK